MKQVIVVFLLVLVVVIAASFARTLLSVERARHDGKVVAFAAAPGNEVREVPLPGDATVLLDDGRTVHLLANNAEPLRDGQRVRVSERVAPWGETWYRLID